ncbi:class I SAM-dependent methyltransferase [Methylobacterium frigidaeris]|uniref:Methyltransferase n=1 Tax=Methylobacterium frigidaeris TaxID=2038277 RepID=A0AA37M3P0_9HYPH|nr:class I SAM-dependent methyltransferase [Methylobacterium frigidaeris]PIK68848.1 SAM-dependent methyltransferase [Methylobacterium frigidaeris]GJD61134.1 putative methyltransferase [Methylobacterium frigidaeris]
MSDLHPAAAGGFAAGAETYARGRPDYPAALGNWLRDVLRLGPGRTVADLGAGTGKFTRLLAATGADVTAIEPVDAMRAQLAASLPGVTARPGSAEAMPLADGRLDALVCAQAFHWFSTPAALAEIRRVLRIGGRLGLVWNVRDEAAPWVAELTGIMNAHEGDAPRYHTGAWRALFPAEGFGPLHEEAFPHGHTGTPEQVILDRTLSVSFIAALPEAERARVAQDVHHLIARTPDLAGRDEVTFPYRTHVHWCERVS